MPKSQIELTHDEKVLAARAAARVRRAEVVTRAPLSIIGIEVGPITPATWSILCATGNAFAVGGEPDIADVRNFILYHQAWFNPDNIKRHGVRKWLLMRRIGLVLVPRFTLRKNRDALRFLNTRLFIQEIYKLISRTWADRAAPGMMDNGLPCEDMPIAACHEAQTVDTMATEYRCWPFKTEIRHTPIAYINQLARCVDMRRSGGHAKYYDEVEHKLETELLRGLNT